MAAQPGDAEGTKAEPTASAPFRLPPRPGVERSNHTLVAPPCLTLCLEKKVGLFKEDPLCDVLYMDRLLCDLADAGCERSGSRSLRSRLQSTITQISEFASQMGLRASGTSERDLGRTVVCVSHVLVVNDPRGCDSAEGRREQPGSNETTILRAKRRPTATVS